MIDWVSVEEGMPANNGKDFLIIDMDSFRNSMCAPPVTARFANYCPSGDIVDANLSVNPKFTHWAELNIPGGAQ